MNILEIRKDEAGKVLIFSFMLGIRTAGYTIGWAAVQTIILKRLGVDSLPYSFIFFAIIGMMGAFIYLFFADILPRAKLLNIFCIFTGILIIIAGIFSGSSLIIAGSLILIGNGIGYSTTGIQIWTIINDTFTPAQGIRLYPIIAIAPLIGSIGGSLLIPVLSGKLGMSFLIIIWGFAVLSTVPLLKILNSHGMENTYKTRNLNIIENLKEGFRSSLNTKLVHVLGAICILFWTVASLKEFQYGKILNSHYTTEAQLSAFYGYFNLYLHMTVLFIQFLFTGRIIRFIGVSRGFCLLPVTIFAGLLLILLSFSFYSAIIMRFSWDIMAMTVQGSVFQLSFNGIQNPYRGRIRGILEGFINPIGGIFGGITLIIVNKYLKDNYLIVTFLGLFFSLFWIYIAFISKKYYREAIIENLKSKDRRTVMDSIEMLNELDKKTRMEKLEELKSLEDPYIKARLSEK